MADSNFREYGWDDEINNEESFTLLPAGDYEFAIVKYERCRREGSEKVPPCNKAIVTFALGDTELTENFLLCSTLEWKLSQLFLSVGLKRHGEPLRMAWNQLPGKRGVCKVIQNNYTKDGREYINNRIDILYAYDEVPQSYTPLAQQTAPQQYTQAPQQQWQQTAPQQNAAPQGSWNGGGFGGWNK
jgi:hypothetical protein